MTKNVIHLIKKFDNEKVYWMEKLAGEIKPAGLIPDFPGAGAHKKESYTLEFAEDLSEKILHMCNNNDLSLYVILLAAFKVLLLVYTGENGIIVASPMHSKDSHDYNDFIPLRDFIHTGMAFKDVLMTVGKTVTEGYKNQHYPMQKIFAELEEDRQAFAGILFFLENIHKTDRAAEIAGSAVNNITLSFVKERDMIKGTIRYNSQLYKEGSIRGIGDLYGRILRWVFAHTGSPLSGLELVDKTEREELLYRFNETAVEYPAGCTIHGLFEAQAARTPGNTAVRYPDWTGGKKTVLAELSYRQLNSRANHVARLLKEHGHEAGSIVALMFDGSPGTIAALLAVLKAGCAFLPLEPQHPGERLGYMLKDSGAAVVLTTRLFADKIARIEPPPAKIFIDMEEGPAPQAGISNPVHGGSPSDAAYVIYTSGTTGQPKGAAVEHRGIVNYTCWRIGMYRYTPEDVTLQLLSYGFDGYGSNLYSSLLSGGTLLPVPGWKKMDAGFIKEVLTDSGVTNTSLVPSMYRALLESGEKGLFQDMRFVVLAGEKAGEDLIGKSRELYPGIRIIIEYGPTEASVTAAANLAVNGENTRIIGKPIANVHVYMLGPQLCPVPTGVPGEICISGAGVSRGYLNNPELTRERFVENPYIAGARLYRTGDMGRWQPDGEIEFIGRIDGQLKIRGYRIELGEIEKRLLDNQEIKAAVVMARESAGGGEAGEKYTCAYLVSDREQELDIPKLKLSLSSYLPDYMIPTYFMQIDKIPLTANGKVNRKALPDPGLKTSAGYTPPSNRLEEQLVDIWSEVLGVEKEVIGVETNFFRLGGHSLNGTTLALKIYKEFNVRVPLAEIFNTPSIRGLAHYISRTGENICEPIEPAEKKEYYPLSPQQKRLFILNRMEKTGVSYNMPEVIELEEETDGQTLTEICRKLIRRHESFRTSFRVIAGQPVQEIHEGVDFEIEYHDFNSGSSFSAESILRNFVRPFDLSRAPVLRAGLAKVAGSGRVLLFDMHHITADGISHGILARDVKALYRGEDLPPLKLQYKDFSQWQNRLFETGTIKKQEEYWLKGFAGEIPVLNLPTDYTRPEVLDYEGDRVWLEIDEKGAGGLKRMAREGETTLFIVLLVLYNILLSKICGQEDIVIGVPAAGRQYQELQGIIGMFVNTLALRNYPRGDKTFEEFLAEVKKTTFEAFENQDYPFDDLVKNVSNRRDMSRNPLFDVMFNFQTGNEPPEKITGSSITGMKANLEGFKYENGPAKFDIMLRGLENGGRLFFNIEYRTKLFKKETMEKYAGYFKHILASALQDPGLRLSELDIIPVAIREERVNAFSAELENE